MPSLEEITRMAIELSADERTMLIERLLQSLEADTVFDIDETSIRVLEDRLQQNGNDEMVEAIAAEPSEIAAGQFADGHQRD